MVKRVSTVAALAALAAALGLAAASPAAAQAAPPAEEVAPPSEAVARVADWVLTSGDNAGLPYLIIDKVEARVFVFAVDGELQGSAPVLLGLTPGDDSAPGVGEKSLSELLPEEKTTPAGRFIASYGPAKGKRDVLWVDYGTALSLHPVVTSNPKEQRTKRLRSPSPEDNRITYGCINVATPFYRKVVRPTLTDTEAIVYILPETRELAEVFPSLHAFARTGERTEVHEIDHAEGPDGEPGL